MSDNSENDVRDNMFNQIDHDDPLQAAPRPAIEKSEIHTSEDGKVVTLEDGDIIKTILEEGDGECPPFASDVTGMCLVCVRLSLSRTPTPLPSPLELS
jgi:hypothetical protein